MKSAITRNRSRRHKGKGGKEQQALLSNASPPPSPSVWGVQDDVGLFPTGGFDTNDTKSDAAAAQFLTQPSLSHQSTSSAAHSSVRSSSKGTKSTMSVRSASPSSSALPPENRFVPQHEPRKGQSPENMIGTAALQFVPAYEEATTTPVVTTPSRTAPASNKGSPQKGIKNNGSKSPTKRSSKAASKVLLSLNKPEASDAPDPPTWDAVIEADDSSLKSKSSKGSWRSLGSKRSKGLRRRREQSLDSLSSAEEKKSSPSSRRRRGKNDHKSPARGPPKVIMSDNNNSKDDEASVISGATSTTNRSRGPRMARLASIFASRATVKSPEKPKGPRTGTTRAAAVNQSKSSPVKNLSPPVLASPAQSQASSGSSGYVGWPGTQDKRGKTVTMESSYDDSSVGAAAFHKKQYQDELDDAATIRDKRAEYEPDDEDDFDDTKSAADFHLAAVLATAVTTNPSLTKKQSLSPQQVKQQFALRNEDKFKQRDPKNFGSSSSSTGMNRFGSLSKVTNSSRRAPPGDADSSVAATSASGALSIHNLFSMDAPSAPGPTPTQLSYKGDPWDVDSSSQPPSSPGTSVSKDSSAFFHTNGASAEFPVLDPNYGVRTNVMGAASIIRRKKEQEPQHPIKPQPPTERALQVQNHLVPPVRNFNSNTVRGYRGYLDKRTDVPNLMDDEMDSDSLASSRAGTSVVSEQQQQMVPHHQGRLQAHVAKTRPLLKSQEIDEESDIFDGISKYGNSTRAIVASTAKVGPATRQTMMNGFQEHRTPQASPNTTGDEESGFNVVTLAGGLSLIQATQEDFEKRKKPGDFDENLSSSEVDQYGFVKTPGFNEMMTAGRSPMDSAKYVAPLQIEDVYAQSEGPPIRQIIPNNINKRWTGVRVEHSTKFLPPREVSTSDEDSSQDEPHAIRQVIRTPNQPRKGVFDTSFASDSTPDDGVSEIYDGQSVAIFPYHRRSNLSNYRLHPNLSKKIVRAYRNQSRTVSTDLSIEEFQNHEDSNKAFALSEMRSRVMEKDLERGLERQGGSIPVDDIILTPYYQAAYRVRDAVIVSKAWRDGASPSDVITASKMTRRSERAHFVKRPMRMRTSGCRSHMSGDSVVSEYSYTSATRAYTMEEVTWMDDADFMQMRCPSLGPRFMRGFEMFTIGDCQSILLKLTNERCIQLRSELNEATARQIDAEDMMKEEGDAGDGMMTESEMIYLTAMEDVKIISKQLVVAEKSFNLVRDRIEKLVARYEAMLIKIENESIATGSIITYDESSYYSDEYDSDDYTSEEEEEDEREREMFQRRAQRAELRAELAAREAIQAKQAAKTFRDEKQHEIDALQFKLAELQSESSFAITEREQSIVLAKAIAQKRGADARSSHHGAPTPVMQDERINGVKQKFRERMAERMKARGGAHPGNFPATAPTASESGSSIQPYRRFIRPVAVTPHAPPISARSQRRQLVGEEMYQHLDFYERSLKAVDTNAV